MELNIILKSAYLPQLTAEVLRAKMKERGLDHEKLMDGHGLIINETEKDILLLLNEDL